MKRLINKQMLVLILMLLLGATNYAQSSQEVTFEGKTLVELANERRTKPLIEHNGEEHHLLFLERELLREFEKGDLDEALSHLADDAMVNPPGIEAIFGRENQKKLFTQILGLEGVIFVWEPTEAYVSKEGEMGYVYGVVIWKMPNEKKKLGKYISIWAKEDGKWMNQVEMRNLIKEEK